MHFLIEAKSLFSSPGKMIGEQYRIIGIAQAETIRHKRDLWAFIERSLRKKIFYFIFIDTRMAVLPAAPFPLSTWQLRVGSLHAQLLVDSPWPSPRSPLLY